MKDEAHDYADVTTLKNLVRKYSQFINFPIYVWNSKVSLIFCDDFKVKYCRLFDYYIFIIIMQIVKEEVPVEEEEVEQKPEESKDDEAEKEEKDKSEDEEVVEEATEDEKEKKPKTKTIEKTVWDWELLNDNKPIWTRKCVVIFKVR